MSARQCLDNQVKRDGGDSYMNIVRKIRVYDLINYFVVIAPSEIKWLRELLLKKNS